MAEEKKRKKKRKKPVSMHPLSPEEALSALKVKPAKSKPSRRKKKRASIPH